MAPGKRKVNQLQRLEQIRSVLLKGNEVSVEELAARFGVSCMTVRRDLEVLESNGEVIRTHGGAALARRLTFEFAFRQKQNKSPQKKNMIAKCTIKHIEDGQVIMLDTGTTTLEIARQLLHKRKVTIITTSLAIISQLQFAPGLDTVLLGGFLRAGSPDMHGPLTEQNIEQFSADIAFIGADAIDDDGNTYTDDLRVVTIDRKMASNAKKVIVVADSTKFSRSAMCKVLKNTEYDSVITDLGVGKKIINKFKKLQINLEIAK